MNSNWCWVDKLELLNQAVGSIGFSSCKYRDIKWGRVGCRKMFLRKSEQRSLSPLRLWSGSGYWVLVIYFAGFCSQWLERFWVSHNWGSIWEQSLTVATLLCQGMVSPAKCYSPVHSALPRVVSAPPQKKVFTQCSSKGLLGGKNPGGWLPSVTVAEDSLVAQRTEQTQGLYRASRMGIGQILISCSRIG